MGLVRFRYWLLIGASLVVGCQPPAAEVPKLRVAAASDLQAALPILAIAFRQEHGIEIVSTFGASGQLSEQIRQGAPFDVFLSANRAYVDRLAREGSLIPDSVRPYARGSLVLAVNKLSAIKLKGLADLSKPEIQKIAIANPEVAPYGVAAKQALERAGLWETLQPRIIPAESVRQALQMVQTGNAEVAFVGRSIADVPEAVVVELPADVCDPIIQYLGVVASSNRQADSKAFTDFVLGEVGQGILFQLGFRGPKSPQTPEKPKPFGPGKVAVGP